MTWTTNCRNVNEILKVYTFMWVIERDEKGRREYTQEWKANKELKNLGEEGN